MGDTPRVAVLHAAPGGLGGQTWGDTHFATSLAEALQRHGERVRVLSRWDADEAATVPGLVVLRGLRQFLPADGQRSVLWVISHPELVTDEELDAFGHVGVASSRMAEEFRTRTATPVHVLHQATDIHRLRPPGIAPGLAVEGIAVVANARWPSRRGPRWLRELGRPFQLFGGGWEGTPEAAHLVVRHVPNALLGSLYGTADIVVADQWERMAHDGFVANRLFDVGAVGGFVLSDAGVGVVEVFGDLVPTFASREELGDQLDRWLGDPAARTVRARALQRLVHAEHTFDHRSATLLDLLASAPAA